MWNATRKHQNGKDSERHMFYHYIEISNSSEKKYTKKYDGDVKLLLDCAVFNTWKDSIIQMTIQKYEEIYGNQSEYDSMEFQELKMFLLQQKDFETREDFITFYKKIKSNNLLKKAYEKYSYEIGQSGWEYLDSTKLGIKKHGDAVHRLYINTDFACLHEMIIRLMAKFEEKDLPFMMKYAIQDTTRDDTIVIWTDNTTLLDTINMLEEIRKENPELVERFSKPPILTGIIDGWIGYGSEPKETGKLSYNKKRCNLLKEAIDETTYNYFCENQNKEIKINGKSIKLKDYLSQVLLKRYGQYFETKLLDIGNGISKEDKDKMLEYVKDDEIMAEEFLPYISSGVNNVLNGKNAKYNQNQTVVSTNFTEIGKKIEFTIEDIYIAMGDLAFDISNIDKSYLDNLQKNIKKRCSQYEIDSGRFYVEPERIKSLDIQPKKEKNDGGEISVTDILQKIINLSPEQRKDAFSMIEAIERGDEVGIKSKE